VALMRLKAEVAGKVWRIEAQAGQNVAKDAPVLILECMKMEIPVEAPQAGRVTEILVREGQTVTEGQDVAVLEG
jgi:acetyl-CoA carboxylase biotin carboxyl carrier protein